MPPESPATPALLGALADVMEDAVVTLDPHFRVRSWSAGAERLLGWSADEAIGRDVRTLIASNLPDEDLRAASERIEREGLVRSVVTRRHKDGRLVRADIVQQAVRDASGGLIGFLTVGRDVSEHIARLEQAAARAEEDAKQRAFRDAPIAILVSDANGDVVDVNRAWEALYRLAPEAARGSGWLDIFLPEEREEALARWKELAALGQTIRRRHRFRQRGADGSVAVRWAEVVATPRVWGAGPERGYVAISFDVTDEVQREQKLADADAQLRAYFQAPGVGIVVAKAGEGIVDVNDAFCSMLGYSRDELLDRGWRGVTHPDDLVADEKAVASLVRGEVASLQREKRYVCKDGSLLWTDVSLSTAPLLDGSGLNVVAIIKDLRLRKAMEAGLRDREERLSTILAAMAEGVVVHDASGKIVSCNDAAERILGIPRAQMEGRDPVDLRWQAVREDGSPFPGDEHPTTVTLRTGKPLSRVVMGVRHPNGEQRWLSMSSEALRREPGAAPDGVVTTFADVTEMRRSQEQLREALANAKTLSGLLPICSYCHKIRDDAGYWAQLESFISERSSAHFSHGICPACSEKHFPDDGSSSPSE